MLPRSDAQDGRMMKGEIPESFRVLNQTTTILLEDRNAGSVRVML
jgi:hypothetical protein